MPIEECPRCHTTLLEARVSRGGAGAFRSIELAARRCPQCKVQLLERDQARSLLEHPEVGRNATERERKKTRTACPTPRCFASLDQITLSWDAHWVVLEQCPRCLVLVADPEEIEKLVAVR